MNESLVIIGNGMAAAKLVQEITDRAPERYRITIIGDEPGFAYNRVLLSSVLAGDAAPEDLPLKPSDWWMERGVTALSDAPAVSVNVADQTVSLPNGRVVPFSKLVFATGSRALRLPVPGANLPGVFVFRTCTDIEALSRLPEQGAPVAVIGGGLLGIEAAHGLAKLGASVTLVHLMDRLMERQLDSAAAAMVKSAIERQGINVVLEAQTAAIAGSGRVEGVVLADGRTISAGAVVMAAGIKPNAELAHGAGMTVRRGIVVDGGLETSHPRVYAIGECAEVEGQCCGLVEPAYAQADVLAARLCGDHDARYTPGISPTNLKVSGLPVFSAGDFLGGDGSSAIVLRDRALGLYKKFVIRDGALAGAVLVGDCGDGGWYLDLIRRKSPVAAFRSGLAFGPSYCSQAGPPGALLDRQAA
jgi:nitrite reductase (NADH) large subunit